MKNENQETLLKEQALKSYGSGFGFRKPSFQWRKSLLEGETSQSIVLFISAIFLGPFLTVYLITSSLPVSTKLSLSPMVYFSILYLSFLFCNRLVNFVAQDVLNFSTKPNFFVEFIKFVFAFFITSQYQYSFIFEPIFKYPNPRNIPFFVMTIGSYSAVAAAIFYKFRQMKDLTLKSKVAQAEAQYSLLESQMQPHFLFNSLNVLSELIYVDPDMANSMTQKMADLYREILNNSKSKFSTLDSEISILLKYVEIQKIRFGDRIHFEVDVSPAYYNLKIPSLMLQTLVENAIKHGISPKKEGGEIKLTVKKVNGLFEVCISNTGALYKGHEESKRSTGLTNTKNRLELTYGSKNSFRIYSDDSRTNVKFLITGRTS